MIESEFAMLTDRITYLEIQLRDEDYKVIKCMEATLMHDEMPYDYEALIQKRRAIRKEINELQKRVDEINK